jgi:hypothetical protein
MKMLILCSVLLLVSCSSVDRQTSIHLREMVLASETSSAIEYLENSPLAKNEKSKLLYFLERGLLEHYNGNYAKSIEALGSAKEIAEQLYTTRISGKILSSIENDNADFYYGEKYETSLIHFYLTLNYYLQAQVETDAMKRANILRSAKAEVLDWDSYLSEIKNERSGKAMFKEDLLAKTFGALVHESQGTHNDSQIALQLYQDARNVFFKNYNLFPSFNAFYQTFRENFAKLPSLPIKEVEGKYVRATDHNLAFQEFLSMKILLLTQKLNPKDFQKQVSILHPSEHTLKNLSHPHGNITFLVQDGLIVEKIPKKYQTPVNFGMHTDFAYSLGLGDFIEFELPTVESAPHLDLARIEALDKDGQVVSEAPLSVIAPLGELAEQAISEHSAAIASKTAARIIGKYTAAVVSAYVAQQAGQQKNGGLVAIFGTIGYAAAIASIHAGEKADLRYWSTLPSNIRMGHLTAPAGTYRFRAVFGTPGLSDHKIIELGQQTVSLNGLKFVMDKRHFKSQVQRKIATEEIPTLVMPL